MKKILSISVIAMLAMVPTVGWAAPDRPSSNQPGVKTTLVELSEAEVEEAANDRGNEYVVSRTSIANDNLTHAEGFKEGNYGIASIMTSQEPRYNVEAIEEDDGKEISTLSYVKGAYNDVITKINKVYQTKSETSGLFNMKTTWGSGQNDVKQISLVVANNVPRDVNNSGSGSGGITPDDRCPEGYGVPWDQSSYSDDRVLCVLSSLEPCEHAGYETYVKGWWAAAPDVDACVDYYGYINIGNRTWQTFDG